MSLIKGLSKVHFPDKDFSWQIIYSLNVQGTSWELVVNQFPCGTPQVLIPGKGRDQECPVYPNQRAWLNKNFSPELLSQVWGTTWGILDTDAFFEQAKPFLKLELCSLDTRKKNRFQDILVQNEEIKSGSFYLRFHEEDYKLGMEFNWKKNEFQIHVLSSSSTHSAEVKSQLIEKFTGLSVEPNMLKKNNSLSVSKNDFRKSLNSIKGKLTQGNQMYAVYCF